MPLGFCYYTYIHTLMAVVAMQGANQHIRSSLGLSILLKDTSTCRPDQIKPATFQLQVPSSTPFLAENSHWKQGC